MKKQQTQRLLENKKYRIGYVPQYGGVFSELTLLENLKAISEIVIENKIIELKELII